MDDDLDREKTLNINKSNKKLEVLTWKKSKRLYGLTLKKRKWMT